VKILLDECVPLPLRDILDRYTCRTAQQMGWKNIRNGELLDLAEGEFDLFITADQGGSLSAESIRPANRNPRTLDEQIGSNQSCCWSDPRSCRLNRANRISPA
jgi:hypothetical protein